MGGEKAVLRSPNARNQYLAAFVANLLTITYGMTCGWPTAAMPMLQEDETPLPSGPLTLDEVSWIASTMCFGGIIGNILTGIVMEVFGRKQAMLLLALPGAAGWLLVLFAQNVYYLYGARVLGGVIGGGVLVVTPAYLSEIANDNIRGALSSTLIFTHSFGVTFAYILGYYCDYALSPLVAIAFSASFVVLFVFLPETPLYLVKKGRLTAAQHSIQFYSNINMKSDSAEAVHMEIRNLQAICNDEPTKNASNSLSWSDFKTAEARKAFMIGVVLVALNQFCGVFAVLNYADSIFKDAGSFASPAVSAITVSVAQIVGAYVPTVLADRAGRKFCMLLSALGTAVALCALGSYSLLKPTDPNASAWLSFIPLISFAAIVFMGAIGVISMPFGIIAEILPEKLKSFGMSFMMTLLWIFCLIILKCLPFMMEAIGIHGMTFTFAGACIASSVFMIFYMPETKGKSYEEIMISLR